MISVMREIDVDVEEAIWDEVGYLIWPSYQEHVLNKQFFHIGFNHIIKTNFKEQLADE